MEKDFYKFEFPSWVNIVATTNNSEILLIRQYRFGTGQVELEIPGGAVNEGEPPLEAGLRELLEETGYAGDPSSRSETVAGKCLTNTGTELARKVFAKA